MSESLLLQIEASGVRNISAYFETLARADLDRMGNDGEKQALLVQGVQEKLRLLEVRWFAYLSREEKRVKS